MNPGRSDALTNPSINVSQISVYPVCNAMASLPSLSAMILCKMVSEGNCLSLKFGGGSHDYDDFGLQPILVL